MHAFLHPEISVQHGSVLTTAVTPSTAGLSTAYHQLKQVIGLEPFQYQPLSRILISHEQNHYRWV
jgi:hypothetical protein